MDDLKNIAPELSKIKKENSFKVPDNYFDDLPMKIQERILQKKSRGYYNIFELLKKPAYAVSFSLVFLMLIIIPLSISIYKDHGNNNQIAYGSLEIADIEYFEISEELLIEAISVEYFDETSSMEQATDEVIDYLIDNIDYSTILNEL